MSTNTPIITSTRTLSRIADAIAEKAGTSYPSKSALLNIIAAEICGPKHNWGFLKNHDGPVIDQRMPSNILEELQPAKAKKPSQPKPETADPQLSALIQNAARGAFTAIAEGDVEISNHLSSGEISDEDLAAAIEQAVQFFIAEHASSPAFQANAHARGANFVINSVIDFYPDLLTSKVAEIADVK